MVRLAGQVPRKYGMTLLSIGSVWVAVFNWLVVTGKASICDKLKMLASGEL